MHFCFRALSRYVCNLQCIKLLNSSVTLGIRVSIAMRLCLSVCPHVKPQEGWLSPTERASVSAHFGLPWVFPWDNRGKFYMDEKRFNACQKHRSIYPSVFNRFPVIQPVSSKVRHFSTFFAHFGLHEYAPGTIAVNFTWTERGFNAGKCIAAYTHLSSTVYEL